MCSSASPCSGIDDNGDDDDEDDDDDDDNDDGQVLCGPVPKRPEN